MTLAGFRIRPRAPSSGCRSYGSAIAVRQSARVVIRDNAIQPQGSRTLCAYRTGVLVHPESGSTSVVIAGNTIRDFTADGVLLFPGAVTARVLWNRIRFIHRQADDRTISSPAGVAAFGSGRIIIRGNDIRTGRDQRLDQGIVVTADPPGPREVIISRNYIQRVRSGIDVTFVADSMIVRNEIHDVLWQAIRLDLARGGTVEGNRMSFGEDDGLFLGSSTRGVKVTGNVARLFGSLECVDESGPALASIRNDWINNVGRDSEPAGLCR